MTTPTRTRQQILAPFERPEQFLRWLGGRDPYEIAAEQLDEESRDEDTFFNLFTQYVREETGATVPVVVWTDSATVFVGKLDDPDSSIALPAWVLDMWYAMPDVTLVPNPIYKTHRAVSGYIDTIRREESTPIP